MRSTAKKCLCDGRLTGHYTVNDRPARADSVPVKRNDTNVSSGNSEKMLLWLMKNFVKALDNSCEVFLYLHIKFPNLSDSKVKNDEYFMAQKLQKLRLTRSSKGN